MSGTTTAREAMIEALVEHSANAAVAESQKDWLRKVFEKGFIGYSKLSDSQLELEMHLHGLVPEEILDDETEDDFMSDEIFG
ncbi:MAG: hypothetical protein WAZ34_13580 [Rhodocyclaceae bacterium]